MVGGRLRWLEDFLLADVVAFAAVWAAVLVADDAGLDVDLPLLRLEDLERELDVVDRLVVERAGLEAAFVDVDFVEADFGVPDLEDAALVAVALVDLADDLPVALALVDLVVAALAAVLETVALVFDAVVLVVLAAVVLAAVFEDDALDGVDLGAALDFTVVLAVEDLAAVDFAVALDEVDLGVDLVVADLEVVDLELADLAAVFVAVAFVDVALVVPDLAVDFAEVVVRLDLEAVVFVAEGAVFLDPVDLALEVVAFERVEDDLVVPPVDLVDDFAAVLRVVVLLPALLVLVVLVLGVDFPASSLSKSAMRLLAIIFSNPAVFHLLLIDNLTVRLLHFAPSTV